MPATAATLALYVTHLARSGRKVATIARALVAISQAHTVSGMDNPTRDPAVRKVMQGIRREHGTRQEKKAPMRRELLGGDLSTLDRAVLLLGFAGGFRRSELAALRVEDCQRSGDGYVITLRHSKTDQEGRGQRRFIGPGRESGMCPVAALDAWLVERVQGATAAQSATPSAAEPPGPSSSAAGGAGPLFGLSPQTVARILKRVVKNAGEDPARYSGHSLRRGCITAAHLGGTPDMDTMRHVGIKSPRVFAGYVDDADLKARAVRVL